VYVSMYIYIYIYIYILYNYWLEVSKTSPQTHCSDGGIKDIIILVRINTYYNYYVIYVLHCIWLDKFIDLRGKQQTRMLYSGPIDLCCSIIIILYFIDAYIIVIHLIAMLDISKKKKKQINDLDMAIVVT
jgi:hypothetical protein